MEPIQAYRVDLVVAPPREFHGKRVGDRHDRIAGGCGEHADVCKCGFGSTPSQRDHERPARHASPLPGEPVEAMALPGCVPTTAIVFSVAASAADAGIPWGEAEGIDFNHDCCGMACHAIGDVGRANAAWRLPGSVVLLTGSSFLHSRSQGPPDRPPRIA